MEWPSPGPQCRPKERLADAEAPLCGVLRSCDPDRISRIDCHMSPAVGDRRTRHLTREADTEGLGGATFFGHLVRTRARAFRGQARRGPCLLISNGLATAPGTGSIPTMSCYLNREMGATAQGRELAVLPGPGRVLNDPQTRQITRLVGVLAVLRSR